MTINLPVGWPKDAWPTDLTLPALTVDDFVGQLRRKGVALNSLDPQLLQVAAFGHYCGSVEGDGHVDFICNNEADFFEQITFAEQGALLLGLDENASLLSEFKHLLPSANIVDVYTTWAKDESQIDALAALDDRLFAIKIGTAEAKALSSTMTGAPKEGFDRALQGHTMFATNPHYVRIYAWLGGYAHLDFGTFREAQAKSAQIVEELEGRS